MDNRLQQTEISQKKSTNELKSVFQRTYEIASEYNISYIPTEFFLLAIVQNGGMCKKLLNSYNINTINVKTKVNVSINSNDMSKGPTRNSKLIGSEAIVLAQNCDYVATEHLLLAILKRRCRARAIIQELTTSFAELYGDVLKSVESLEIKRQVVSQDENNTENQNYITSIEGTILENFGYDLTDKARKGRIDPIIGRDDEIKQIISTLSRKQKNNPLVIGEPGTGKTAVVEGLAQRIVSGDVTMSLKNKIIFSLDLTSIVAGAKMRGEFEQRFKEMIEFIQNSGNIILFIDEIHNLVSGAKSDGVNASEILKPALARGELQLIGATTISEYRKYIEKDTALERRFQPIILEPPTVNEAITIIKGLRSTFELHHDVDITDEAITAAVTLSDRYITDRFLPDKAIDLVDEASARARIIADTPTQTMRDKEDELVRIGIELDYAIKQGKDSKELSDRQMKLSAELDTLYDGANKRGDRARPFIDGDDIANVISDLTKIPVSRLTETEAQKLLKLEDTLHKRVIGQTNAVSAVAKAIKRAMTGVQDPNRPIGTFLFAGPTGVGKTELSKALAETLFGDEDMLIRIDMSEYMEPNSVAKLIGAPPGYVGYDEEGQLTEKVRRKPYSVVLFDEVEKAHSDVFNLFLQIFDDGRLTDSKGRLVDFKNTIIIMTSNVGAKSGAQKSNIGFGAGLPAEAEDNQRLMSAIKRVFKPEFINRIDEIVQFNSLSKEDCGKICKLLIDNFKMRLAQKNIFFSYSEDLVDLIVDNGYNAEFGARPLKRAIINMLEDEISERMLKGEIKQNCRVRAVTYGDYIDFIVS